MTYPGSRDGRLRVVLVGDADSFVKWGAHLVDQVPDISAHVLLLRTPLVVSAGQERAALHGTRFAGGATRIPYRGLSGWLAGDRPDVVVIAGRAPFVRLVQREIDTLVHRPVTVSGLSGMSIPAQRGALELRRFSDLVIVHSRREVAAFSALAQTLGFPVELGLATLPFARRTAVAGGTDLVFAAQSLVPQAHADRQRVADILIRAAHADPARRVVVKLRSLPGENETHADRDPYTALFDGAPANLVFSAEPMADALTRAEGLVTISSTATVEAVARGIPVIALDSFGIGPELLNPRFEGSGLFGSAEDVVARRFRHPDPTWLEENYFHDPAESTWWLRVQELVAQRRRGALPARRVPPARGGVLHAAWHRKSVLGEEDRTITGAVAAAVGIPAVKAILALRRRSAAAAPDDPGLADVAIAPVPFREPIRRRRPSPAGARVRGEGGRRVA